MPEVQNLIAEAKQLLAKAEKDLVEHADATQIRLAVKRLEMFIEHLAQLHPVQPVPASEPEPPAESAEDVPVEDAPKRRSTRA